MKPIDPQAAMETMWKIAPEFAKAKGERVYLEEYRKSKKALLMAESTAEAANAREQYAYAHPEYIALLGGLREAVEVEEKLRWDLIAAQARIEVWRSQEATSRAQERATA